MSPEKSLTTLEFDKVIARLAAQCQTARGRALALALKPSTEYAEVLRRRMNNLMDGAETGLRKLDWLISELRRAVTGVG